MDDAEWEQFIVEWAEHFGAAYSKIERLGGPGDQGRDVVCYVDHHVPKAPWDCFQCKYYDHPLMPSDVWLELGKLCYYTHTGSFTRPRAYTFCAPRGVGTSLAVLLKRPDRLLEQLIENWDKYCATKIGAKPVALEAALLVHIKNFDFSILDHLSPMEMIEGHRKTKHFIARFGGGLPARPVPLEPTPMISSHEMVYVRHLLDAYEEHLAARLQDETKIPGGRLRNHFERSRREFYFAESLREFSRDNLPGDEYESLQYQVLSHVADIIEETFIDGYARVKEVAKQARLLPIDSHPLKDCISPADKAGICHQLANQDQLAWVKK